MPTRKKLFLIIGAPGSGKTTDAQIIAQENNQISHYSTGDMLREEVNSGTALGLEINTYISQGLIVPIKIAIETITKAIKSAPTPIILLDGYPRSIEQMQALETFLEDEELIELAHVIEVAVTIETASKRVLGRSRGADDASEVFDNRMKVYTEPLSEIQNFYALKKKLQVIDGERTIEEVVADMSLFIDSQL